MNKQDKNPFECAEYGEVAPLLGKRPTAPMTPQEELRLKEAVQLLRSGELTLEEVDKIEKEFERFTGDRKAVYQGNLHKGLGLYQAITKEFVEALFQYLSLLGCGRIVEIGAGDGKLSASLRKKGLDIIATDDGSWSISPQSEVITMSAEEATAKFDIFIFSWPPLSNVPHPENKVIEPPDLTLAKAVHANPQKTLIILGAECTGSSEFWANVMGINRPKYIEKEGQMVMENPAWLNEPPPHITVPLQQHKPKGLNHIIGADGNFYQLGRSRSKNLWGRGDENFVLVLRSPDAPRIPSMKPLGLKDYVPPAAYQITCEDPLIDHVLLPKDHL